MDAAAGATSATVTGLTAGGSYDIAVVATNGVGDSAMSVVIMVTVTVTGMAIRPTITDVSVLQSSISVTWDTASNLNADQIKVALFDLDDNGDVVRLAMGYPGNVHTINPAVNNPGAHTFDQCAGRHVQGGRGKLRQWDEYRSIVQTGVVTVQ